MDLIREAIEFHLEGMLIHGESVPEPTSTCDYVEVERYPRGSSS